ncbi:MAG: hypothetical protein R2880_04585 [Deinococcales bacterium]
MQPKAAVASVFSDSDFDEASYEVAPEEELNSAGEEAGVADGEVVERSRQDGLSRQAVLRNSYGYTYFIEYDAGSSKAWKLKRHDQFRDETTLVYEGSREIDSVAGSADGSQVVVSMRQGLSSSSDYELYLLNLVSKRLQGLTNNRVDDVNVSMSQDMSRVAWQAPIGRDNHAKKAVYYYDFSLGVTKRLNQGQEQVEPSISSNGNYLVMLRDITVLARTTRQVMLYNIDTNRYVRVTVVTGGTTAEHPSVSDDGRLVMWLERSGSEYRIKTKDVVSGIITEHVNSHERIEHPHLELGGEAFVYSVTNELRVQNVLSGEAAINTRVNGSIKAAYWQAQCYPNFEDASLEGRVKAFLGLPENARITCQDMEQLGVLDLQGLAVTSLKGLEYATNLFGLNTYWNPITDLSPLAGLKNLNWIDMVASQVSDLSPLVGLKDNLKGLYIAYNPISDFSPLAELVNLEGLYVGGTGNFDANVLTGLTNLVGLIIIGTNMSDTSPLANLNRLNYLDLGSNSITDISPLANLSQLTWLSFDGNLITDISPLANLNRLNYLFLNNNQISDISPLTNLNQLVDLRMTVNTITDISALANLNQLYNLLLSYNQISDISPLANLTNMVAVELSYNPISDSSIHILESLNPTGHLGLAGINISDYGLDIVTRSNTSGFLNLGENSLSQKNHSLLANLPNIAGRNLSLSLNGFSNSDLSSISGLSNLDSLSLSYNPITDLSLLNGLSNLKVLFMDETYTFSDLSSLAVLPNLEALSLWGNQIVDLMPLAVMSNLRWLRLTYNGIEDVDTLVDLALNNSLTSVSMPYNCLDLSEPSDDLANLAILEAELEYLEIDPQWSECGDGSVVARAVAPNPNDASGMPSFMPSIPMPTPPFPHMHMPNLTRP